MTRRVGEIGRGTALTCLRDAGTLDWNGSCGNVGLGIIGKYVVIKTSAVDKVAHRESRECEGKRAINSSEQHPHPRGHQKQGHVQKELEGASDREHGVPETKGRTFQDTSRSTGSMET